MEAGLDYGRAFMRRDKASTFTSNSADSLRKREGNRDWTSRWLYSFIYVLEERVNLGIILLKITL